jgi:hypothetical protein
MVTFAGHLPGYFITTCGLEHGLFFHFQNRILPPTYSASKENVSVLAFVITSPSRLLF